MKMFASLPIAAGLIGSVVALSPDITTGIVTLIPLPSGYETTRTPQTGCPTVTSTRELCATCPVPACLQLEPRTQSCGCPSPVPTVYLDYPCSDGCKNIWCSTSYSIVTETACSTTSSGSVSQSTSHGTTKTATPTSTSSSSVTSSTTFTEETFSCEEPETETETETDTPNSTTHQGDSTLTTKTTATEIPESKPPVVTTATATTSEASNRPGNGTSTAPTSTRTVVLANSAGRMRVFGGWGLGW
ncbi:hypothetical protein QBC42DRAFT_325805 [Cladorrhinum samala]|uniref:Uncharacterized protein n=1 Tax=Cladorrhinum samala TaxID=585594 RepID=A0AAV9HS15_9PEZI|nr:hypothetical protein QBC42DRAFT_325805 [Cladorrhinum samala]